LVTFYIPGIFHLHSSANSDYTNPPHFTGGKQAPFLVTEKNFGVDM